MSYRRNDKMLLASTLLTCAAVIDYYFFFDVLAPEIAEHGSVRANMGAYFILPVLLLTAIQLLYSAGVLHLVTRSFYFEKRDFLKAFFVASILVFLFSLFFVLVPSWGPYLFLVGSFRGTTASTYLVLALWTGVVVMALSATIRRVYRLEGHIRWPVLVLLSGSLFLIVMAFAEG